MSREEQVEKAVRRALAALKGRVEDPEGMLRYWLNMLSVPTLDPMVAHSIQHVIRSEFTRLSQDEHISR